MAFITNFFLLCLLKCNLANVKNKYVILRHLGDMCLFTSARINRISPCCLKITYIHTRIIRKRLHPRNNIYVRSVDYTWLFLTTQRIRFWNLESPKCIFSPFWGSDSNHPQHLFPAARLHWYWLLGWFELLNDPLRLDTFSRYLYSPDFLK